jgi:hypothetical protein
MAEIPKDACGVRLYSIGPSKRLHFLEFIGGTMVPKQLEKVMPNRFGGGT